MDIKIPHNRELSRYVVLVPDPRQYPDPFDELPKSPPQNCRCMIDGEIPELDDE